MGKTVERSEYHARAAKAQTAARELRARVESFLATSGCLAEQGLLSEFDRDGVGYALRYQTRQWCQALIIGTDELGMLHHPDPNSRSLRGVRTILHVAVELQIPALISAAQKVLRSDDGEDGERTLDQMACGLMRQLCQLSVLLGDPALHYFETKSNHGRGRGTREVASQPAAGAQSAPSE